MFPRVAEKVYIRAIREVMEQYGNYDKFDSPEQVFQWWVSGENADTWLAKDRHKKFFY